MSLPVIRNYFQTRLLTYAQSKSYPLACEGVSFKKPTDGIWLQCYVIPSPAFHRDVACLTETQIGLFQVNVWGVNGKGTLAVETAAEEIKALFPVLPREGAVCIDAPAFIEKPILDNSGWLILPITIKYRLEIA